jgi:TIGR03009 family protein
MRYSALALAVVWMGAPALAQQGVQPSAQGGQPPAVQAANLDPAHNRLDALLLQWEQKMQAVKSLAAQCTLTKEDKTFKSTDVFEGTAQYLKPNLASLYLIKKNKPDVFERYICTGTYLYEFVPQSKIVRVHELPPPKNGQVADDNLLSFLFGMKAEEAKRRYELSLAKEDQYWIYINVLPRFQPDQVDFNRAQLVLSATTFMPRRLWFEQPNGNEVTWEIPQIQPNASVNRSDFTAPRLDPGWKLEQVPRRQDMTPRVVRPKP